MEAHALRYAGMQWLLAVKPVMTGTQMRRTDVQTHASLRMGGRAQFRVVKLRRQAFAQRYVGMERWLGTRCVITEKSSQLTVARVFARWSMDTPAQEEYPNKVASLYPCKMYPYSRHTTD